MRYVLLVVLVALAGCETEAELQAQRAAYRAQIETADNATCINYGLERATPQYADCRLRLSQIRQQNEASRRAAVLQWYGMQQKPIYTPAPSPARTNCQWIGNQMNCTTF